MKNGLEIAVKKLSLNSRQGVREFTNEVKLLLKVQHRNLASLGARSYPDSIESVKPIKHRGTILLRLTSINIPYYKRRTASLDWSKRFEIIVGVAKGLLYLHEESPVKIIHRDIKASNILLDNRLNPKIADFGMARLFQRDDTHVNTFKISGTL
ncbi:hypothetical protein B296_00000792 [Ensete ventricosum]|uniref:non-specific serine/threonine protein kinase n=1 Tax=Ensete ventricosum TaxID=4639 RepID=A0A427BA26_ENSVE|nr:hypothetical protein B296_00000792 [Ensete ventricosum]